MVRVGGTRCRPSVSFEVKRTAHRGQVGYRAKADDSLGTTPVRGSRRRCTLAEKRGRAATSPRGDSSPVRVTDQRKVSGLRIRSCFARGGLIRTSRQSPMVLTALPFGTPAPMSAPPRVELSPREIEQRQSLLRLRQKGRDLRSLQQVLFGARSRHGIVQPSRNLLPIQPGGSG
jgi:hypothetical protein